MAIGGVSGAGAAKAAGGVSKTAGAGTKVAGAANKVKGVNGAAKKVTGKVNGDKFKTAPKDPTKSPGKTTPTAPAGKSPQGAPGTTPNTPGNKAPAAPTSPQTPEQPKALKNGDWLHNPRDLTPDQAKDLEKMMERPDLHPKTKEDIKQFLDDYKNGTDRLFPDDPKPLHKPYPTNPAAPKVA